MEGIYSIFILHDMGKIVKYAQGFSSRYFGESEGLRLTPKRSIAAKGRRRIPE
jgi:hypothetical protein